MLAEQVVGGLVARGIGVVAAQQRESLEGMEPVGQAASGAGGGSDEAVGGQTGGGRGQRVMVSSSFWERARSTNWSGVVAGAAFTSPRCPQFIATNATNGSGSSGPQGRRPERSRGTRACQCGRSATLFQAAGDDGRARGSRRNRPQGRVARVGRGGGGSGFLDARRCLLVVPARAGMACCLRQPLLCCLGGAPPPVRDTLWMPVVAAPRVGTPPRGSRPHGSNRDRSYHSRLRRAGLSWPAAALVALRVGAGVPGLARCRNPGRRWARH